MQTSKMCFRPQKVMQSSSAQGDLSIGLEQQESYKNYNQGKVVIVAPGERWSLGFGRSWETLCGSHNHNAGNSDARNHSLSSCWECQIEWTGLKPHCYCFLKCTSCSCMRREEKEPKKRKKKHLRKDDLHFIAFDLFGRLSKIKACDC